MGPNFYYDQEDFLRERQVGSGWSYTVLRPEAVCGYAVGNPMNLAMVIGVYAAISKELGLPLRFPGPEGAYRALYQVTSAEILAKAAAWAGSTPAASNEIFNITNGDYFRWQFLWPKIAKAFRMEVAEPVPMPLAIYMADKAPLWERMTATYGLEPIPYDHLVSWPFGDFIFNSAFDNISSTVEGAPPWLRGLHRHRGHVYAVLRQHAGATDFASAPVGGRARSMMPWCTRRRLICR